MFMAHDIVCENSLFEKFEEDIDLIARDDNHGLVVNFELKDNLHVPN